MPHMTTYGPQLDQKWTGSGAEMDRKWTGSGVHPSVRPSFYLSVRPEVDWKCPSVPNTSLTSLTNLMRGNYKRRALAPCDFLPKSHLYGKCAITYSDDIALTLVKPFFLS